MRCSSLSHRMVRYTYILAIGDSWFDEFASSTLKYIFSEAFSELRADIASLEASESR